MNNARFRLTASITGATLCLFAATASGQNTNTTTGTTAGTPTAQTGTAPTTLGTQPGTTTGTGTDAVGTKHRDG